jgi:hypothetical protein
MEPARAAGWRSAELHLARARALASLGRGEEAEAAQAAALALNPRLAERNLPPLLVEH